MVKGLLQGQWRPLSTHAVILCVCTCVLASTYRTPVIMNSLKARSVFLFANAEPMPWRRAAGPGACLLRQLILEGHTQAQGHTGGVGS